MTDPTETLIAMSVSTTDGAANLPVDGKVDDLSSPSIACRGCGGPLPPRPPGPGRPRQYCTVKCRRVAEYHRYRPVR